MLSAVAGSHAWGGLPRGRLWLRAGLNDTQSLDRRRWVDEDERGKGWDGGGAWLSITAIPIEGSRCDGGRQGVYPP